MIHVGDRFGRLTVIGHAGRDKHRHALLECRCECGTVRTFRDQQLTSGFVKSCRCLGRELCAERCRAFWQHYHEMKAYFEARPRDRLIKTNLERRNKQCEATP